MWRGFLCILSSLAITVLVFWSRQHFILKAISLAPRLVSRICEFVQWAWSWGSWLRVLLSQTWSRVSSHVLTWYIQLCGSIWFSSRVEIFGAGVYIFIFRSCSWPPVFTLSHFSESSGTEFRDQENSSSSPRLLSTPSNKNPRLPDVNHCQFPICKLITFPWLVYKFSGLELGPGFLMERTIRRIDHLTAVLFFSLLFKT